MRAARGCVLKQLGSSLARLSLLSLFPLSSLFSLTHPTLSLHTSLTLPSQVCLRAAPRFVPCLVVVLLPSRIIMEDLLGLSELQPGSAPAPSPAPAPPPAPSGRQSFSSTSSPPLPGSGVAASAASSLPTAVPHAAFDGSQRIASFSDVPLDGEDESSSSLSAMHLSNAGFFDKLGKASTSGEYTVTFQPGSIGLTLDKDTHGRQCVVKAFRPVKHPGSGALVDGPAKRGGLIVVGDVVTKIDGMDIMELTFKQTMMRLREVQDREYTLTLVSIENAKDLSMYSGDKDINESRKHIHLQKEKWYIPPGTGDTDDLVYCYVERIRGQHVVAFNMHREDTGEFMIAASLNADLSGSIVFHTTRDSHLRRIEDITPSADSAVYLGSMTRNFLGEEFTLHNHRFSPNGSGGGGGSAKSLATADGGIHELAVVRYEPNIFGRVPNFMTCMVPRPEAEHERGEARRVSKKSIVERYESRDKAPVEKNVGDHIVEWFANLFKPAVENGVDKGVGGLATREGGRIENTQATSTTDDSAAASLEGYGGLETEDQQDLLVYETKKPSWSEKLSAWTLNFNGRVKKASKKNFLLVQNGGTHDDDEAAEEGGKTYIRFGKHSKHRFILDFRRPLSPVVALGICVSTFSKKITVA